MSERGGAATLDLHRRDQRPRNRQTTRTTKRPAPSAPLNRIGDDAVAIIARAAATFFTLIMPVASDSESSDPVHFMVYLPLFALPQRSVESLSPSGPPPPQPPSDHRQLCRRLSDLPPLAPLPSAPRCRSSATWKDRSSSASLTFARSCQPVCGGGAVLAAKALAALQNGCDVRNRTFPSHPSRLEWVTKQQPRVRSIALSLFRSTIASLNARLCSCCKCSVFVCEPVSMCVLTKLRVLLRAAPCAVVRVPLTLVHTVLRVPWCHCGMVEPAMRSTAGGFAR